MTGYLKLLSYLKEYKLKLFVAVICLLGATGTQLFLPWIIKDIIDDVFTSKDMAMLNFIVVAIFMMFILRGFFVYGQQYLMTNIAQRVIVDIRMALFSMMMRKRGMVYYEKNKVGKLMSFFTNDINALQSAIVGQGIDFITEAFILVFSVASMLYIDWKLTLLLFITVPLIAFSVNHLGKRIRFAGREVQVQLAELTSLLQEILSGIRVVKSFAREEYEINRFYEQIMNNLKAVMRSTRASALLTPIVELFAASGVILLIWYGGREVINGNLTSGALVAFLIYAVNLSNPLKRLSRTYASLQSSMAAAERIFKALEFVPEVKDMADAKEIKISKGEVLFENVSFSYEKGREIIKNINFQAEQGKLVALVGHSGAGKTTLVNLIPRFYDISSGVIKIDGVDIKTVTQKSLRDQIGIVPQETILFSGTIAQNIQYGRLEATESEIRHAAEVANAIEFIEKMPQGFQTQIGERGVKLSGGQKQRLAIARAVLKNPRILILDEATSALDTESEKLVQCALDKLLVGRTSFVIAHRLSTILNADLILVMRDGTIVERGTHNELLKQVGVYSKLYKTQFSDGE